MKIPGIKEFPTDEKIWRIDWIGEVDLNPSVPSEPSLKIIVSPLVDEKADPFSNNSVVHTERRVLKIGVGQFPLPDHEHHDPGPFPEGTGLMESGVSPLGVPIPNPGRWLPHEDWYTANITAPNFQP